MLKSLGTEFKVGVFALVALATLGYMFFVLSPDTFQNKEYRTYYTVLRNAAGIVPKTHVKTSGVSIGKVKSVALEGGNTRVMLEIDKAVKVPVGTRIEIRAVGLLGDKHLEVIRAEDSGTYIDNGGFIPQSEDGYDIESLMTMVGDIGRDVKKITNSLAAVFGSKKGEQSITNIIENIEGLTGDLRATAASMKDVLVDRRQDFTDIITDVRSGVADLRTFSRNLKDVLDAENKERIDRILASFDETMVDVKASAKSINLVSDKIEKGEGTIGRLVNDDNTLAELEGAIKDIRKVIAPANRLQIEVDFHSEVRRDKSAQHYMNVMFRTRPDRYYLIGMTDTRYDRIETRTVGADSVGNDDARRPEDREDAVLVKERVRTAKAIRFNMQIARRWYDAEVRFGLFETTGGIAGAYHLFNDKLTLNAEAFDWDTQDKSLRRTAHIKTYASLLFYNHVYAMAGIDDPTRTDPATGKVDKKTNVFAGAGFSFTDEDLKAIFGAAALSSAAK